MVVKHFGVICLAVVSTLIVNAAQATDLTLNNPSFQSNSVDDGATSTTHSYWGTGGSGTGVTWNPTSDSFDGAADNGDLPSPAAGSQCIWVTSEPSLYQAYNMLTYSIEADKIYTLSVAVGAPKDRDFGYYGLFLSGADIITQDYSIAASASGSDGIVNRSGLFYNKSVSFNTGSSGRSDLVGRALIVTLSGDQAAYDNVRLTVSSIPEPSAILLLATGTLAGLCPCVWRRMRHCV